MKKTHYNSTGLRPYYFFVIVISFFLSFFDFCHSQSEWSVIIKSDLQKDEALKVCVDDLKKTGIEFDMHFTITDDLRLSSNNAIIVGDAARNKHTSKLVKSTKLELRGVDNPQGYEIVTLNSDNSKTIIVAGGSLLGDVYGLYWLQDRLKVFKTIPDINTKREPAFKIRYTRIDVKSKEDIKRALRYGLNLVYIRDTLNLVPWHAEPEGTDNSQYRQQFKELIDYVHALHIKVLAFGTDFTFHPSLMTEFGATLSPCDPCFWDAVQAKYRRLLQALPELDGIATFLGEEQSFWGNYQTFDPIHDAQECGWTLEKRYRTFVKKVHSVVVSEFDKIYHHRTWITNCYEQQSRPEVYRNIFTDDVPTKNLYLIPSFTQNDRWWHQRYNPTFNQTPHNMLSVLEPMNYYESSKANLFATYPGSYFQAGLQSILEVEGSNLHGGSFDLYATEDHNTSSLTAYTVFRLGWDYRETPQQIAEDFCAIHFGREVAKEMAEIYLLSPVAYKYGLAIEPVAYGEFNSLPQIRVGTFPAQGYPSIDYGKEHIQFWRAIYLRCKPWLAETLDDLEHGMQVATIMAEKYAHIKHRISDTALANDVDNRLQMTRLFIQTNNRYVKTSFAYFQYRDDPTEENRTRLYSVFIELLDSRKELTQAPGFGYQLFGVDQLIENVEGVLDNLVKAELVLNKAPTAEKIENTIIDQQKRYLKVLKEHANDAIKFLHFEGQIDGRDILTIHDKNYSIEHLRWDPPMIQECRFERTLPQSEVTVIPIDIQSRPMHPFILEQPNDKNNYAAKVYLYDVPGGRDWVKFDLYYIPKTPSELDLKIPWKE